MNIVLYANRNVGMVVYFYLLSRGHSVKVITEDVLMIEVADEVVTLDTMGDFDLFICCHGRKIIDSKYLIPGKFLNVHPCLFKYKGHNPIKRYIENKDTLGSVEVQHMVEEVDAGEVIARVEFETPAIETYAEFYNIALPYYIRVLKQLPEL
jgi:methionyl-tRNA formyltransferase